MNSNSNLTLQDKLADEDGEFRRLVDSTSWYVPIVELQGENLIWDWRGSQAKPGTQPRRMKAKSSLLWNFIRLHESDDNGIARFARKWGVLFLCEHGKPSWHVGEKCLPLGDHCGLNGRNYEPIAGWRRYSCMAHDILDETARIRRDIDETRDPKAMNKLWNRQVLVAMEVQRSWLDQAGVSVEFFLMRGKPKILLGTHSLFAVLSVQLMATVTGSAIAICCNCGNIYIPERRPRIDQRNYCEKEECKLAALRDAQRDHRSGHPDPARSHDTGQDRLG